MTALCQELMHTLLLYLTPIACRVALSSDAPLSRIALSLAPLLVVLPSVWLPKMIRDEQWEHVVRHGVYALSFSVSIGTSVRWDVIAPALRENEPWAWTILAYLVVGSITLWWFCASHMLENRTDLLYTHQGDVAVLPLTLVAIATFANDVPDEAFQFSRSIIFYVPIVVAWATLMFVAFNDFAILRTTTYHTPGFLFLAAAGLVIGSAHLALLEVRAPPLAFQFFPLIAAVLCQVTPRPVQPPTLRPCSLLGSTVTASGAGGLVGRALSLRFLPTLAYAVGIFGTVTATVAIRRLAGRRWVLPATLYAALVGASLLHTGTVTVRPFDVIAIGAVFHVAFTLVSWVAPAVYDPMPPWTGPPAQRDATPQRNARSWSMSKMLARVDTCRLPLGRAYDASTVARFFDRVDRACPSDFVGVWWMEGNTFPMDLICVHRLVWSADGSSAHMWNRRHTSRRATVAGALLHMTSWISFTHISVCKEDPRWIRTDQWFLPGLRLFATSYWLYRVNDDEMLRLVYDSRGRVVWQYRMKRIARDAHTRTRFHADFLRECEGASYLLAL